MAGECDSPSLKEVLNAQMNNGLQAILGTIQELLLKSPHLFRIFQALRLLKTWLLYPFDSSIGLEIKTSSLTVTRAFWISLMYGQHFEAWGRQIRSSPQSDLELLHELDQYVPHWNIFPQHAVEPIEFYDVVQWLKTSPNLRPDLIKRWQSYLKECIAERERNYYAMLEMGWG
ncbi:hypothetical protein B0H14DRAFT_2609898 [Mycena olivaceomarginata]|nr:hypothetical protein B0H14DRAFT_2609898 [Mycena olivaceomarginata]